LHDHLDDLQIQLLNRRIVSLEEDVDYAMSAYVHEVFLRLIAAGCPDVFILFNSTGGSVTFGGSIYDCIRAYPGKTTGVVVRQALSVAAIILQACDYRVALPHSSLLIHHVSQQGNVSLDTLASGERMNRMISGLEEAQRDHYNILSERTGKHPDEIRARCEKDTKMAAGEALEFGLIDKVIERLEDLEIGQVE
jgi:ATP-dependent Clp protease protease subunit